MRELKFPVIFPVLALLVSSGSASAALHDCGGGLIYDDVLDVTWLQDVSDTTTGAVLDGAGQISWADAQAHVDALVYYDALRDVNWTDWRLPRVLPQNGVSLDMTDLPDGSTDQGYNITSPKSEFSHLFYVTLGNIGQKDVSGGLFPPGWGLSNTGPFQNLQAGGYWYQTEHPSNSANALTFGMGNGHQANRVKSDGRFIWALRDGNVAPESCGEFPWELIIPAIITGRDRAR